MHSYLTEIIPKTWLHERSRRCIQRLSSTTIEHIMNNRRSIYRFRYCACTWLRTLFAHQGFFCLILFIRYRGFRISHTHHLLGYPICFLLIDISWLVDLEFRLEHWWARGVNRYAAKIVAKV